MSNDTKQGPGSVSHGRNLAEVWKGTAAAGAVTNLCDSLATAEANNERLQQWVNDLQAGCFINCVYCGHRYGPDPGTPVAMADVLREHIEQCPEHPLSEARAEIERLREAISDFAAPLNSGQAGGMQVIHAVMQLTDNEHGRVLIKAQLYTEERLAEAQADAVAWLDAHDNASGEVPFGDPVAARGTRGRVDGYRK